MRGALGAGVTTVQVRERGLDDNAYVLFLRDCVTLTQGTGCRLLVNDRVDLAMLVEADGVHLRENSVPIESARRLSRGRLLIGRSVHDASTAATARNADYMIAGSVFATPSKPGQETTLGLDGLRRVVSAAGDCPVWAVGGLTSANVADVRACGVQGVAAIGTFLPPAGSQDVERDVRAATAAFTQALEQSSGR
jgi:thiamine-phosphate pyrophosphorylase